MIGVFCTFPRAAFNSSGYKSTFRQAAVSSIVTVGGNKQGDLAVTLIGGVLEIYLLLIAALPAQAALMRRRQNSFDFILIYAGNCLEEHKQLSQLLIQCHICDGFFHPSDLLIAEIIRLFFQIYHAVSPFPI